MDVFSFSLIRDFVLVGLTAVGFVLYFQWWARSNVESNVNLVDRLPTARIRLFCFFAALICLCWSLDFSPVLIYVLLLVLGVVIALITGGDFDGGGFGLIAAIYFVREWSFGFPELKLQPPLNASDNDNTERKMNDMIGKTGTITSPLRPWGEAEFDGVAVPVVSEHGGAIDAGIIVRVTGTRNGRPVVNEIPTEPDVA